MTAIGDRADALQSLHDTLKRQGMALRRDLLASVKRDAGSDRALSGIGNKPKLGVRLRTEQGKRTSTVSLQPSPKAARGPWSWMDQGTRPGMRRSRKRFDADGAAISRRQAQVSGLGGGVYYHKGTSGKSTWFGTTEPFLRRHEQEMARRFDVVSR